eukprot:6212392-Pleurochrysis_carterae.AAC.4
MPLRSRGLWLLRAPPPVRGVCSRQLRPGDGGWVNNSTRARAGRQRHRACAQKSARATFPCAGVLPNTAAPRSCPVRYGRRDRTFWNHARLSWRLSTVRGASAGAGAGRTYRAAPGRWRSQAVSAMRATGLTVIYSDMSRFDYLDCLIPYLRSPLVSHPPQFVLYVVSSIHSVSDIKSARSTHRADA